MSSATYPADHSATTTIQPGPSSQAEFLVLLPTIQRAARFAFRYLKPEAREDALQEVIAHAFSSYSVLTKQGRAEVATATSLARYAIAHYRVGRRVAHPMNHLDVSSHYSQRRTGMRLQHLHRYDAQNDEWQELVVEDRSATPAETAATRIDFAAWLESLSPRMRAVAKTLATGESTGTTATRFRVTPGRISQLRRKLQDAWHAFHGESAEEPALRLMTLFLSPC